MAAQFIWPNTDKKVSIIKTEYQSPKNIALLAVMETEAGREPFGMITVNVQQELKPGRVAIKDWSENEGLLDVLVEEGIVSEPLAYIPSGFVEIPVCRLLATDLEEE